MEDHQFRSMTSEPDPRVFFAAERTFLSWIRTGLALMGFGFVVARFGLFLREIAAMQGGPPAPAGLSRWFGIGLIGLGVLLTAASTATHVSTHPPPQSRRPVCGPTHVARRVDCGAARCNRRIHVCLPDCNAVTTKWPPHELLHSPTKMTGRKSDLRAVFLSSLLHPREHLAFSFQPLMRVVL